MTPARIAKWVLILMLAGCSSPTSPASSTGPSLVSPGDGTTQAGPDIDFTWDAVTGATRYYHQMSSSPTMLDPLATTLTVTSFSLSPPSPGTWWWRVRASVSGQTTYTPWSEIWSFTVGTLR